MNCELLLQLSLRKISIRFLSCKYTRTKKNLHLVICDNKSHWACLLGLWGRRTCLLKKQTSEENYITEEKSKVFNVLLKDNWTDNCIKIIKIQI